MRREGDKQLQVDDPGLRREGRHRGRRRGKPALPDLPSTLSSIFCPEENDDRVKRECLLLEKVWIIMNFHFN